MGCKKDLRYDNKTIEELRKTSQKPVTPEEVSAEPPFPILTDFSQSLLAAAAEAKPKPERLGLGPIYLTVN